MSTAKELLARSSVRISPETYGVVSVTDEQWRNLLGNPALSPRMTAPFMIFKDPHEITLVLDETDLVNMRAGLLAAKIENGYRMLTFEVVMEHSVVGFMAEVSRILAESEIAILPISAFSRDNILIKQDQLAKALIALGPHVGDLC
jgi:hypothetical protein